MHPWLQVIIGELIGALILLAILRFDLDEFNLSSNVGVLIFGIIIFTGALACFYFGRPNLFFSDNVIKNIFIIMWSEEIICVAIGFIMFVLAKIFKIRLTKADVAIYYYFFLIFISMLEGYGVFYNLIMKAIGAR